jgi:hypothetical protein
MLVNSEDEIVKSGTWLYGGTVASTIRITRGNIFRGTGDYEDPPETQEDLEIETFNVWFESLPGSGCFSMGGGQYLTLEEAISNTQRVIKSSIEWE